MMPPTFRPPGHETKAEQDRRRGTFRDRGYTTAWSKASIEHRKEHPLCVGCDGVGRIVVCEMVDHILPRSVAPELTFDKSNWQCLCWWHHRRVKPRLEELFAQGKITRADLRCDSDEAKRITLELDPL
jgi:5-methylcytosine-specific restriction endonuclease McrA